MGDLYPSNKYHFSKKEKFFEVIYKFCKKNKEDIIKYHKFKKKEYCIFEEKNKEITELKVKLESIFKLKFKLPNKEIKDVENPLKLGSAFIGIL